MGLISDYLSWVKEQYGAYGEVIAEKELGVGSDIAAISNVLYKELGEPASDFADWTIDVTGQIGLISLDFIRGLGGALVDGVDSAYDTARNKLRGKEPDVIAAVTIGFLTILTIRYLYKAVGRSTNASE